MMLLGIDDEHAAFSYVADPGLIPTSAAPIKDASFQGVLEQVLSNATNDLIPRQLQAAPPAVFSLHIHLN